MNKLKKKIAHIAGIKKGKETYRHSKTGCALASVFAALVPTLDIIRSSGQSNPRIIQNFVLVWLDSNSDEFSHQIRRNTISIFRHIINSVHAFTEVDECVEFISGIKEEKIFLIVSETLGETTMPIVHAMPQVTFVYILCENKLEHELWVHKWSKIKDVYMEMSFLYEALKQAAQECDRNTISISFIERNDETTEQNLDKVDQSFIYAQILKEIVLKMNFKQQDIKEFITYYRQQTVGNITEQRNIDKLEREYHDDGPIWWYTSQCFLYSMLNRSLRLMEIENIIRMSF